MAVLSFSFWRVVVGRKPTQDSVTLDNDVGVVTTCRRGISQGLRWK